LEEIRKPIRMCICCYKRYSQNILSRFKCKEKQILPYDKKGRSFYVCDSCLGNEKKLEKSLFKLCKNKSEEYIFNLKESFINVRQS
jgi:predicted RNA-binding protein YlxR (DUF448 family)